MLNRTILFLVVLCAYLGVGAQHNQYATTFRKIYDEVLLRGECYQNLDYLCNKIGGRLSGSPQAEQAVQYMFEVMKKVGYDTVFLQPVMVPKWERGEQEQAYYIEGKTKVTVNVCALGGSVATPKQGLTAMVVEVKSIAELKELGKEKINGKIVFFNRPMDPTHIHTGAAYGGAGDQRVNGPAEAAKYGAVGVIVRSLTLANDEHPHTGMTRYIDSVVKIPACAISTKHADRLSKSLRQSPMLLFTFKMNCITHPDVLSYNVIGELRGNKFPHEVIIAGGHLDSWDNGDGAHDDGAGCVQSIEAVRLIKASGLTPKRTLRTVLFMNEENGLRGGLKYAEVAATEKEIKHIAAIESDAGGFTPRAFGIDDSTTATFIAQWENVFKPYGIEQIRKGGGGADIGPLKKQGTVLIGYIPDSQRYFDYHHTSIDTFDKVNKRELELGAAAIASLMWLMSEEGVGK